MLKDNLLDDDVVKEEQFVAETNVNSEDIMGSNQQQDSLLVNDYNFKKPITEKEVDVKFTEFINNCHRCQSVEKQVLIKKAYLLAKDAHKGSKRNSGDAFINHPVEVAVIVTEDIGLGATSAVCSLLHDVVSNSEYTIEDIEHFFGPKIALIVDNLTKIKGTSQYFTKDQSEVYRKLLVGLSEDIRIIFIKLADRLHNMRTLYSLSPDRQKQVAYETRYIYAPLAERLGLFKIKSELEDLAFKYLNPEDYEVIAKQIEKNSRKEQIFINRFSLPIIDGLLRKGIRFDIKSRLKSIYSIYKKIQNKNVSIDEVYDVLAIRIIFEEQNPEKEVEECLEIYKFITSLYVEKSDRTRNWLGENKKSNGYEALHVTVRAANNKWVEVQLRSKNMDAAAETGFAAHWKYKGIEDKKLEFDNKIFELKQKLEQVEYNDFDYLENFKLLFTTEIVVYTPKGKEIMMPVGSTALDYAFYIHTQIGSKAMAAKINRKLTGLEHILQSGDTVEIITSEKNSIKSEWLNIVKTDKAKLSVKELLNKNLIIEQEKGLSILSKILEKHNVTSNSQLVKELENEYNAKSKNDLYFMIGTSEIDKQLLEDFIRKKTSNIFVKYWKPQLHKRSLKNKTENQIFTIDDDLISSSYLTAECCFPIPGDEVTGILNTKKMQITIHKKNCTKLIFGTKDIDNKEVPIIWKSYKALSFLAKIEIEGNDNLGMINKITTLLSNDLQINFRAIHINADGILFSGWMEVYVHNTKHLEALINKLKRIDGILNVKNVAEY